MIALIVALIGVFSILAGFPLQAELDPEQSLRHIRQFRHMDARLPIEGQCEKLLLAAQKRLDRLLTDEEIFANLNQVFDATGELLIQITALKSNAKVGFARFSTIDLWDGSKTIAGLLKHGMEVVSVNLATGERVRNKVHVNKTYFGPWIMFEGGMYGYSELLVSPSQPLFDWSAKKWLDRTLSIVEARQMGGREAFVSEVLRGRAVHGKNLGAVIAKSIRLLYNQPLYKITLAREPHNLIVEGYVIPDAKFCRDLARYK